MKNRKSIPWLVMIPVLSFATTQAQSPAIDSLILKKNRLSEEVTAIKATLAKSEAELNAINALLAPPAPRWTHKGITGISLTQLSFSNWNAGGQNSVASNIYVNAELNYAYRKVMWNTSLNTIYGKMYTPAYKWYKADDNINLTTRIGYSLLKDKKLYGTFLVNFQSQYARGKKSPLDDKYISTWLAPGFLNLAAGLDYKPNKWFSLFYSPLNGRITFVEDSYLAQQNAFGIGVGENSDFKLGSFVNNVINLTVSKNISVISKLDLFTAYDSSFGNVVMNWDGLMAMKVSKYITSTVNVGLKYDDRIKTTDKNGNASGPKIQMKELIGIGLAYTF